MPLYSRKSIDWRELPERPVSSGWVKGGLLVFPSEEREELEPTRAGIIREGGNLPELHVEFLKRDLIRNRYILSGLEKSQGRMYLFVPDRPHDGILCARESPRPGIPWGGTFSPGSLEVQVLMAARMARKGTEQGWTVHSKDLRDYLSSLMDVKWTQEVMTYSREVAEPLEQGAARLLTGDDIPALEKQRPSTARRLRTDSPRGSVFGVVTNGTWLADAWTGPAYDQYWVIGSVFTNAEHRQKGYGRAVVSACVNYLLSIGKIPLYETYAPNYPSIGVAESCGFSLRATHYELVGVTK